MPDDQGRLFADDVAAQAGITSSDFRARVSRGHAPAAIDHVVHRGAVRSVWDPQTIAEYLAARQIRLAGRDDQPADQTGAPADAL